MEFDDGARRKKLIVTVVYGRKGTSSGHAYLKDNISTVRIISPMRMKRQGRDLAYVKMAFAKVACHEFAHNRGMHHRQMPAYYRWEGDWKPRVAWAADMPLEVQTRKSNLDDRVVQRRAHTLAMFQKAQTRFKRAKTLLVKWQKRVRYYERQAAASPTEQ